MIKYVSRKELNVAKYDRCIKDATNSRCYAYSWYLDAVTDNWGALVTNDYKAVMPLPYRSKIFIKYIYLPSWVQQLGVFSSEANSSAEPQLFLNKIPRKFKYIEYYLNSQNQIDDRAISKRLNYILDLSKPYQELFNTYKKGRKSDLNQVKTVQITYKMMTNVDELVSLFNRSKGSEISINTNDAAKLKKLIAKLVQLKNVEIIGAYKNNNLIGGCVFIIDSKRITYLFSASNHEGRKYKVISVIIDNIIQKFASSNLLLDFEGSIIPSLASYFRSFGAKQETYYHYKKFRF